MQENSEKTQSDTELKCSICGHKIEKQANGWDKGHNAMPVNNGRCCDTCNTTVVIPTRIADLKELANDLW